MSRAEKIVHLGSRAPSDAAGMDAGMDRRIPRNFPPLGRIAIVAGGIAVLAAAIWFLLGVEGGRVVRVEDDRLTIGAVARGTFEDFIPVRGRVAPQTTVYLETIEGGRVERALVEDGAQVKAGDLLIELSNTGLQLDAISREAQIAEQMNNLRNTELFFEQNRLQYERDLVEIEYQVKRLKREVDRKATLVKTGAISQSTYDGVHDEYEYYVKRRKVTLESRDAERKLRTAQLVQLQETVDRLQSNLGIAQRNLDALNVRAPIDGQLTALDAEVGQTKERGARLGQVDATDAYKIEADVDEFYVSRVNTDQKAQFAFGGRDQKTAIAKIYPQIRNGQFKVDFRFDGETPAGLRRGQAVDVKLELGGTTAALTIPNGAFYQDTGGNWIFVVSADGKTATRRNVRLGRRNPNQIEVLEGLEPGEKVVVSSYQSYLQMDRIDIASTGAAAR